MFVGSCASTETHSAHTWNKTWVKAELPDLWMPESYPDSWETTYRCSGHTSYGTRAVQTALREYDYHTWDAGRRFCACGEFFEASLRGHALHAAHRMQATLDVVAKLDLVVASKVS